MQVSSSATNIEDNDQKQIYLQIMSDKFCMRIISSIINDSKTAVKISKETSIPISTVYRRLQFLQENKIIKVLGGIGKDGKFFVYKSRIKTISAMFDGEDVRLSVTSNSKKNHNKYSNRKIIIW
jgi:DNA-binding transcriptional regulator YhcF (GntR family)